MTNYIDNTKGKKEVKKKTIFKKYICPDSIVNTQNKPEDYENVEFIKHNKYYGDVFHAWNDNPKSFTIYFGEKGDEFE